VFSFFIAIFQNILILDAQKGEEKSTERFHDHPGIENLAK